MLDVYTHFGVLLADVMEADEVLSCVQKPFKRQVGWRVQDGGEEKELVIDIKDVLAFQEVSMLISESPPPLHFIEMMTDPDEREMLGIWLDEYPNPETMTKEVWDGLKDCEAQVFLWRE